MTRSRTLCSALLVAMLGLFVLPAEAMAQARQVNAGDIRRTERVIRDINKIENDGILSMGRSADAVAVLLTRLAARGASSGQLDDVGNHYSRSVSAIRIRQQARINAIYNAQLRVLRALSGSESLITQLTGERDNAIAALVDAENTALGEIADAVSAAGGT